MDYCKEVLEQEEFKDAKKCIKKFNVNEGIKLVYDFLNSMDENLANQYLNILRSKDEKGNLIVNIIECEDERKYDSCVENGHVYIYYDESLHSMSTILHEMLHKMNECNLKINDIETETTTREFFSELVSITGEFLFGNYLVENNIISEDEYKDLLNFRIWDSKLCANEVIVQRKLINMRLQGIEINYDNSLKELNKYDKDSVEYKALLEEKNTLRNIKRILEENNMPLRKAKRYVLAQAFYQDIIDNDMFLKLHYEVGNPSSDINEVYEELKNMRKR